MSNTDRTFLTLKYRAVSIPEYTLFLNDNGILMIALDKEDRVCDGELHTTLRTQYILHQLRSRKVIL